MPSGNSGIRSYGLNSYHPSIKLSLTNNNRIRRMELFNARAHWDEEQNMIVISDESRFCLLAHDGRRRITSRRGEKRFLEFAVEGKQLLLEK